MSHILHISESANLGLHAMVYLASHAKAGPSDTRTIAEALGVSQTHLAKVMQRLAKAELVVSKRGPKGGFVLRKDSGALSLREIYEAIEGPLRPQTCLLKEPICGGNCLMGNLFADIHARVVDHFNNTTLEAFLRPTALSKTGTHKKHHQNRNQTGR